MELKENKIEFDLQELVPLLIADKTEGFREIGEKILNAILEKEFEAYIGAGKHERNEKRRDYRNGYKERQLKTTLGTSTCCAPMPEAVSLKPNSLRTIPGSIRHWCL